MLSFPAWRCILKVQNYTREKRILMDKILIINDSIVQSKILESILQPIYLTEIENDSQNAVKKAERFLPSLIILDIIMPVKDGFQVLAELKANPRTDTIPVILITGLSDIGNEEKGLMLGAVDYITKPFSPAIIKARIKAHIQLCNYRKAMEHLALFDALTGLPTGTLMRPAARGNGAAERKSNSLCPLRCWILIFSSSTTTISGIRRGIFC